MGHYAFIFARGGSKGLPGKNIKLLNGKPLIAYSIELAKTVKTIKEIFVSTDNPDIAQVAKHYNATIIERPAELAADYSPEWLAWQHAIEWVRQNRGVITTFISLPATSPLRNKQDVITAIKKLDETKADICIGITPANRTPYFNMVKKNENGQMEIIIKPNKMITRRQDAPKVYDITTVVYAAKPNYIMSNDAIFSGKVVAVEIPKERAIDIDDIYDFTLAQIIMMHQKTNHEK